jgi:hypothetical protein
VQVLVPEAVQVPKVELHKAVAGPQVMFLWLPQLSVVVNEPHYLPACAHN